MEAVDLDGTVVFSDDKSDLVRYRARTDASKPHMDIVSLPAGCDDAPGGRNLVGTAPHDHAWHLGCWFVQKVIDGVNCWESERHAANDRLHGRAMNMGYEIETERDIRDVAAVTQDVRWETSDGDPLVTDRRHIGVHDPSLTNRTGYDGYLVSWKQTLTAVESRRYLSSESYHGRYSGLSLRFSRELTGGKIRLPDAEDPEPNADTPARWCDYTGALDGRHRPNPWCAGITVFSHPKTGPVDWFTRSEPFALVCANPVWRQVRPLEAGESIFWKWGLWVHAGHPDRATIESVEDTYRTQSAHSVG